MSRLTVVLVLPNALWQIDHGFPMLEVLHNDQLNRHALRNGMADESPNRWINALYMFGLQFAYQNPLYALFWVWGLIWLWRERAYRFLAVAYLILLGMLILTIGRGYYIQGLYPALFAAGAVAIERRAEHAASVAASGDTCGRRHRRATDVSALDSVAAVARVHGLRARHRSEPSRTSGRQEPSHQSDVRRSARAGRR